MERECPRSVRHALAHDLRPAANPVQLVRDRVESDQRRQSLRPGRSQDHRQLPGMAADPQPGGATRREAPHPPLRQGGGTPPPPPPPPPPPYETTPRAGGTPLFVSGRL